MIGIPGTEAIDEGARTRAAATDCAVVLAAGLGSRLQSSLPDGHRAIKPLVPVRGVPLLLRSLVTLRRSGVREVVVVSGYGEEQLTSGLELPPEAADLRLRVTHNAEWRLRNGVSVLAARAAIGDRPFLLAMGDHLYGPELVARLRAAAPEEGALTLAVDRRVSDVHDLADAVKVRVDAAQRIAEIGKQLTTFDAVDTGVFLATPRLFDALDACRTAQGGDCSLVDGVARMAAAGRARVVDIGDAWWQDVDDAEGLRLAEQKLARVVA